MKAFLIVVSLLCFCGILLCLLAYATGQLPMPKTTQHTAVATILQQGEDSRNEVESQKPTMEENLLCSPCVERIAFFVEMIEREWEEDRDSRLEAAVAPAVQGWVGLSQEQREEAKQLFKRYGTAEGLRRLRETDPDAAAQFDWERREPPVPSKSGEGSSTR